MAGLYATLLGSRWATLARPVQRLHGGAVAGARGELDVTREVGLFGRLLAKLFALPPVGRHGIALDVADDEGGERWSRTFGDHPLVTRQWGDGGLLRERFGPIELSFALDAEAGALVFRQRAARFCLGPIRIPIPSFLAPRIEAEAHADGDQVRMDVRLDAPLAGRLLHYRGKITPP